MFHLVIDENKKRMIENSAHTVTDSISAGRGKLTRSQTACKKAEKSGCGRFGRERNSGWN
jgi:hypothetical protein